MKKIVSVLLALMLLCCTAASYAEAVKITVTGSASVYTDPDIVTLSTDITAKEETILAAQQTISGIIEKVLAELEGLGIAKDDIVTSNYYSYPSYDYSEENVKTDGYVACHTLSITCRDLTLLDQVVSALSHAGVTEIGSISYDKAEKADMYSQALTEAVAAAQLKAQTLALAAGKTTVTIESITESSTYAVNYARAMTYDGVAEKAAGAASNVVTQISSGSVAVSATVEVVFAAE